MTGFIVVGTDGSRPAEEAVSWAADDAVRKGLSLLIVHAHPDAEQGEAVLAKAASVAGRPGLAVTTRSTPGSAVPVLRRAAEGAAELVVGSRGVRSALLGSVSLALAGHGPDTVVVVHPAARVHDRIVVGVDQSPGSEAALSLAFAEAARRGATLHVLHAWQHVPAHVVSLDLEEVRRAKRLLVAELTAPWQAKFPDVRVIQDAICADPVTALTKASGSADLVVVGSRGRGELASFLLGSVSRGVLQHARCPVAVVQAPFGPTAA